MVSNSECIGHDKSNGLFLKGFLAACLCGFTFLNIQSSAAQDFTTIQTVEEGAIVEITGNKYTVTSEDDGAGLVNEGEITKIASSSFFGEQIGGGLVNLNVVGKIENVDFNNGYFGFLNQKYNDGIYDSTFTGNQTGVMNGGLISEISNSTFDSNEIGILNQGYITNIKNSSFSNNKGADEDEGIWIKPYTTFENVPLKNGPKVSNISYGTLVGYDSNMKHLRNGWHRVLTGYLGYNGASQRYSGIDTYQNGGLLGGTMTFYKNNFFNATTISAGSTVGISDTMYGSEDYTMFMSGIGNKFGYDFEFKDGKFIFQPTLFLSYSFINTFDYTNAAGIKIKSDPLHAIQIAPGVKFIMNTENGWQPYLRVDMVWNILNDTKVKAGDVSLPEMSIKPYVQYGLGVQKQFKNDTLTFFGQALVQNGGRNGVGLNVGVRWAIGKE